MVQNLPCAKLRAFFFWNTLYKDGYLASQQQVSCPLFYFADPLENFLGLMQLLLGAQHAGSNPASLVKEAAQGHTDNVRRILSQNPAQVCDSSDLLY